ncbi:MAG: N-acetyltransferase [Erythrobacter sp.]|nr:N-acetyltransferase [Erythrobacter sp.]RZV35435.1 MAG: N-acetyltransferase [Sphingomonadaceae bacterium]
MSVTIRPEQPGDEPAIRALVDAAFHQAAWADGNEGELVERLRSDGDLALSLVAVNADKAIIGHIAFSPITIENAHGEWYQLAPVSVIPSGQNSGIGTRLIEAGKTALEDRGGSGIALVGSPEYYSRFGFTGDHQLELSEELDPFLQILILDGSMPSGKLTLATAFDED